MEGDSPTDSPFPPNVPIEDKLSSPDLTSDNSQPLDSQLGLLTPLDQSKLVSVTLVPTSNNEHPGDDATDTTPTSQQKSKKLRKRTVLFKSPKATATQALTTRKLKDRVTHLEYAIKDIYEVIDTEKNKLTSNMLDQTVQTKNSLKVIINEKHNNMVFKCDTLENKVEVLEQNQDRLSDIIKALKERVSDLEKDNAKLKLCIESLETSTHTNVLKSDCELTSATPATPAVAPRRATTQTSGGFERHVGQSGVASGHMDDQASTLSPSANQAPSPVQHDMHDGTGDRSSVPSPSPGVAQGQTDHRTATPVPPTGPHTATRTSSDGPDDFVRHEGRGAAGVASGQTDLRTVTPVPSTGPHADTRAPRDGPVARVEQDEAGVTSGHRTNTVTVTIEPDSDTNALLIGDSVIRGINPNKNRTDLNWKTIVTPGCRPKHIRDCLEQKNPNSDISEVILHVGVNNTKQDSISMKEWSDTLKSLMFVYPLAHITASAIVPSKGKDQMHQNIQTSNTNLKKHARA